MAIYLRAPYRSCEKYIMQVQGIIEHTTLADVIESSQIYYDPCPSKTIIEED